MHQNDKSQSDKNLERPKYGTYKPAYKENPTTDVSENLPDDLAEIVTAWPHLPEYIKSAIKALTQAHAVDK